MIYLKSNITKCNGKLYFLQLYSLDYAKKYRKYWDPMGQFMFKNCSANKLQYSYAVMDDR